ncbi:MAG: hypothetical protein ACRD8O_03410 [Bryobacteraceae bacterium]
MTSNGFLGPERQILQRLHSPAKIQRFLDERVAYNTWKEGPTCRSPRRVLRDLQAQCLEGALFAAAALRYNGFPPLLVDLEATRDDDHVLAVFRLNGCWGAVAKSNYSGLRYREPVYRSLRELAMSYFEHYYNPGGQKTLRAYSRPVNLTRFDRISWMVTEDELWPVSEYLFSIPHIPLVTPAMAHALNPMDTRSYGAGMYGAVD